MEGPSAWNKLHGMPPPLQQAYGIRLRLFFQARGKCAVSFPPVASPISLREPAMRLLVVEDHPILADGLIKALKSADYAVDHAADGDAAIHMLSSQPYDAAILDIGLPGVDGYEVLRRIRRKGSKIPVLMLTARDALDDRVKGLDLGADDYLTKPYDLPELEARVRALIRRGQSGGSAVITHGELQFDSTGRRATFRDAPLDLSARELGVLEVLLLRAGRVVSKDQLAEHLYGWGEEVGPNAIEVYVHRLRRKLEHANISIRTIRGLGYLWRKPLLNKPYTLRSRLLLWVSAPMVTLWMISTLVDHEVARGFVNLNYDRALLDTAIDLGRGVRTVDQRAYLDLPQPVIDMLVSGSQGKLFFRANGPAGEYLTGEPDLPDPPPSAQRDRVTYYDAEYAGQPVRAVAVRVPVRPGSGRGAILIQVAEKMELREESARQLMLRMMAPQAVLVLLAILAIWFGVGIGLRSLNAVRTEIAGRTARDLSPITETGTPAEILPLVRTVNDLLARVAAASTAQQRFIADAAHQLRTPVAALKAQTELALRESGGSGGHKTGTADDGAISTLQQIHTAADHATRLINQLLSLAHAEPGEHHATPHERLDLGALARDAASLWAPRGLARGIDLGFDCVAGEAVMIMADALLVREALNNLIDNALRYTPAGGQVTIRVRLDNERPVLEVEDSGRGIPDTERERVFERFYRVPGSPPEGAGLGLSIVREIARNHHASITLHDGPRGQGIRIVITFPPAR